MDKKIPTEEERQRAAFPVYALEWNAPDMAAGHPVAYLTVKRDAEVILTDHYRQGAQRMARQAVELIARAHETVGMVRWHPTSAGWVAVLVQDPGV